MGTSSVVQGRPGFCNPYVLLVVYLGCFSWSTVSSVLLMVGVDARHSYVCRGCFCISLVRVGAHEFACGGARGLVPAYVVYMCTGSAFLSNNMFVPLWPIFSFVVLCLFCTCSI